MEYLKDFHFQLLYHPGKANVVADALSRKGKGEKHQQVARLWAMTGELVAANPVYCDTGFLANLVISNDLIDRIKLAQVGEKELNDFMEKSIDIQVDDNGIARFRGRLCVLKDDQLRNSIMKEAHRSKYSIHPGVTKIYPDLK